MEAVTTKRAGTTRAEILAAALESFNAKGFTATTVDDIRVRSGASVGSIYHHFGGKEQIAAALYVEGLAGYQAGLIAVLRGAADAETGIRGMVRHHLRWVAANRELGAFLINRRETEIVAATEEPLRELNRDVFAETAAWYGEHAAAGSVRELPFDLLYSIGLGPAQEYARHWLVGRSRTSIKQAERTLADAAWGALARPTTGDT
jgi:AcrR family transcriptional regulator